MNRFDIKVTTLCCVFFFDLVLFVIGYHLYLNAIVEGARWIFAVASLFSILAAMLAVNNTTD